MSSLIAKKDPLAMLPAGCCVGVNWQLQQTKYRSSF
jgi:hypothetical protein